MSSDRTNLNRLLKTFKLPEKNGYFLSNVLFLFENEI